MALERDLRDRDRERERERKERQAEIARTNRLFGMLLRRMEKIMASMDDVLMSVYAQRGQIESLVALTGGIKAKLEEALAGGITPAMQAKIDEVFKNVEDNRSAIVKAINANDDDPNTPPVEPPQLAESRTSVISSNTRSNVGESVTFSARVEKHPSAMDKTLAGTVSFTVDGAEVGSGPVDPDGSAATTVATMTEGEHAVVASYGGSEIFAKSASAPLTQTVVPVVLPPGENKPLEPASQG